MIRNKLNHSAITCAILAIAAFAGAANAAVATSNVPVTMAVTSPSCTVANSNASIILPQATGPGVTVQAYLTASSITTPALSSSWFTNASLNQTATITCNAANTTILSIGVQSGTSAKTVSGGPGFQLLVDAAASPAVAGVLTNTAGWLFAADLVSVNGTAAPYAFINNQTGAYLLYSTAFNTGALSGSSSTATFIWHPVTYAGTQTALIGNPTGGTYAGSYQVVVNY